MARSRAGLKKVVKTVRTKKGVKRQSFWVRAGEAISANRGKIAAGLGAAALLAGGAYAYSRRGGSTAHATASFGAGTPDPARAARKPRTPEAPGHFGAGTPDPARPKQAQSRVLHMGAGTGGSGGLTLGHFAPVNRLSANHPHERIRGPKNRPGAPLTFGILRSETQIAPRKGRNFSGANAMADPSKVVQLTGVHHGEFSSRRTKRAWAMSGEALDRAHIWRGGRHTYSPTSDADVAELRMGMRRNPTAVYYRQSKRRGE